MQFFMELEATCASVRSFTLHPAMETKMIDW
jgi:hypothetical protein